MKRNKGQDTMQRTREKKHLGEKQQKQEADPQSNIAGPQLSPHHVHKHKNPHAGSSPQAALCVQMEPCYIVGGATSFMTFHIQSYGYGSGHWAVTHVCQHSHEAGAAICIVMP